MSIVTDALNRLQSARAQKSSSPSESPARARKSKEAAAHEKPGKKSYDTRFLTVSVGGFLVILAMAVGAYWWGQALVEQVPQLKRVSSPSNSVALPSVNEKLVETESDKELSPTAGTTTQAEGRFPAAVEVEENERALTASLGVEAHAEERGAMLSITSQKEQIVERDGAVVETAQALAERKLTQLTHSSHDKGEKLASLGQKAPAPSVAVVKGVPTTPIKSSLVESEKPSRPQTTSVANSTEESSDIRSKPSGKTKAKRSDQPIRLALAKKGSPSGPTHSSGGSKTKRSAAVNDKPRARAVLSPAQRLIKGQLLIEQQAHARAVDVLEPLFASPPETWEPWFWMGTAQLGLGELTKAEEAFMQGLVRDDTIPYLWVQRGVVEQQRGNYAEAMDALRQAALLDPDLPEVQLNLAFNLENQGNSKLALQHYRQYLTLTEGKSTYHAVRRKVLERLLQLGNS